MRPNQLNLSVSDETVATLAKIQAKYGTRPTDYARRVVESACQFYLENGWFEFPVVVRPAASESPARGGAADASEPSMSDLLVATTKRVLAEKDAAAAKKKAEKAKASGNRPT